MGKKVGSASCTTSVRFDQGVECVCGGVRIAFTATCDPAFCPLEFGPVDQWRDLEPYSVRVSGIANRDKLTVASLSHRQLAGVVQPTPERWVPQCFAKAL